MIEHVFTIRRPSLRALGALAFTGVLLLASTAFTGAANAQTLGYAPADPSLTFPQDDMAAPAESESVVPERLRGTMAVRPVAAQARPVVTTLPSGRQAMNISTSTIN